MPLSGRINVRYSLSHQQRVNTSQQSEQLCKKGKTWPRIYITNRSAVRPTTNNEQVCSKRANHLILCCDKNAFAVHWTLCKIFCKWNIKRYFRNIEVIIIIWITIIIKTRLLSNGIPQSYLSSIIPTSIVERPNWMHHFSVSTVVCRHVDSTIRFGRCFEEAVPLRFSQCNDSCFMVTP